MFLLQGALAFLALFLALQGMHAWGGAISRLWTDRSDLDAALLGHSFRIGTGLAAFSTLTLYLGLAGLWQPAVLGVLLLAAIVPGMVRSLRLARRLLKSGARPAGLSVSLILFTLGLFSLPVLVLPPHARDALVYHLEVPRQFLLHQGYASLGGNVFGFFPMGIEMLYLPCLAFFPPFTVQVVHFGFLGLLLFGLAEFRLAILRSDRLPSRDGWLLLALATVPTLWRDATWAYIDAGWVYFGFLTVAAAWGFLKRRCKADLLHGAVFLAFYLTIKYPGFYFILILALVILASRLAGRMTLRIPAGAAAAALLLLLLVAGPYYLRNLASTGNPLFPFFTRLLGSAHPHWSPDHEQALKLGILGQYGENVPPALAPLMFVGAAFNPVLDDPARFDGVIGPFLLLWLIPLLLCRRGPPREILLPLFIAAYLVAWGLILKQARFLMPVLPVILMYFFSRPDSPGSPGVAEKRVTRLAIALILVFNLVVLMPPVFRLPLGRVLSGGRYETETLEQLLPVYRCQQFINQQLPREANLWVLLTGNENFYLQRRYQADYIVEDFSFQAWLARSDRPEEILNEFRSRRATHLLIRTDLVFNPAMYIDKLDKFPLVFAFFRSQTEFLYEANGFAVFRLKEGSASG